MASVDINEELILKISKRDNRAFKALYDNTRSAVYGYALSILKNVHDAEDVMHDAYVRIFSGAGTYRPSGRAMAWILTIVRNLCYDRLNGRHDPVNIEDVAEPADEQTDPAGLTETRMLINTAMSVLDDSEYQIVSLHALTGWKHREIADFTGIPLSTVLSKYRRALVKMKQAIG